MYLKNVIKYNKISGFQPKVQVSSLIYNYKNFMSSLEILTLSQSLF